MRSSGLQSVPTTPGLPGFSAQGRHAHKRLSKLRPWKFPFRPVSVPLLPTMPVRFRRWRTCVHSPWMHLLSGVNGVAIPMFAPTWPPWVAEAASSPDARQESGAQEFGVLGSQTLWSGPQASTVPPPVTRQPAMFVVEVVLVDVEVLVDVDVLVEVEVEVELQGEGEVGGVVGAEVGGEVGR